MKKQMNMKNKPLPREHGQKLKDVLQKVKEVLARCACLTMETVIYVVRRLRERGIWLSSQPRCDADPQQMPYAERPSKHAAAAQRSDRKRHRMQQPEAATTSAYGLQVQANTALVKEFLQQHYEVRYNVLDHCAEVRRRSMAKPDEAEGTAELKFHPVNDVTLNTIVLHLHESGIACWDRDVSRLLHSRLMPQYHPLSDYLSRLPAWDGTDRLTPLAQRVSDDPLWLTSFACWMRAMVRQWLACVEAELTPDVHVLGADMGKQANGPVPSNQLALILISREQGQHKSSFCRMLLPEELRTYYTDKFELVARANLEFPLCRYALVNLDEFDRYSTAQMTKLKNLMQLSVLSVRRPRARHFELLRRTASFIGTSNTGELLTDPTGSRRFYCQEVNRLIDIDTPLDYAQLYAQLLHEVAQGLPCYLSKDEEARVQQHNRAYYRASALGEAFLKLFCAATDADCTVADRVEATGAAQWLSATEIFKTLQDAFGSRILTGTPCQLGRQLTFLQVRKKHTVRGTLYWVKRL